MKTLIMLSVILGSLSSFASKQNAVQIEIKADTYELCREANDVGHPALVEKYLRETHGLQVMIITNCLQTKDGRFKKVIQYGNF